jgi:hypothetical protein
MADPKKLTNATKKDLLSSLYLNYFRFKEDLVAFSRDLKSNKKSNPISKPKVHLINMTKTRDDSKPK